MASFDENGKYIKTNWKAGDKITATKLNKIEESIEAVNDIDISRYVEADARLDALEAKDVAHDKELTNIKNTIADNKAAAELGDYDINSRMTFLEEELNDGIEEVHNVAETVDGKIAQGKADMEAMVAEVEADLEGLHAKDDELSEKIDDISINVNDYKNQLVDGDWTNILQELVNNYSKIYFPSGDYTFSNISIPSDTEIICSMDANITVTGKITNTIPSDREYTIDSTNPVTEGDSIISLSDTTLLSNVQVGDMVRIYNNGWLAEDEWIEKSAQENVEFKSWQISKIKNVGTDTIELDGMMEFSSEKVKIYLHNETEHIKIKGGKWNLLTSSAFTINKCRYLEMSDMDIIGTGIPLYFEYIYDSKITNLNMQTNQNAAIWIARGSTNVCVNNNTFENTNDFCADAAVMVFDSCKYIKVYNNKLVLKHINAYNHGKIMIGISIHTVSNMCEVFDNYIKGYSYGISSHFGAKNNIYRNNQIELCGSGIYIHKASYSKIQSNVFKSCGQSELIYSSTTGGVSFHADTPNYRIDVTDNIFIGRGINIGSTLYDCNFTGNTFINGVGISAGNSSGKHFRINVSFNKFKYTKDTKGRAIDWYCNYARYTNINNNTFENVTDCIRIYGSLQSSNIFANSGDTADRFLVLRQNSYLNRVYNNTIVNIPLAFSQEDPSSLNDYRDNFMSNVETQYNFTDSYNMSKATYLNSAPIGFVCHSIEPGSDYIYYVKTTEGNTLSNWQKIKKYL